ncbi:MAG: cyclic nucleotide-binding domain-containing protein, partial [Methanospirillum sp.]|nr:cyclic nucleotide-binding domain-containing protein [Methanospirillum sp.]
TGKKKDLHYVSTVSVGGGVIPGSDGVFFSEFSLDVGQEIVNPYVKSKFEAEKLVRNAAEQGIHGTVFRAGNITFDSENGGYQYNVEENAFFQQVRAYVNLGMVPDEFDQRNLSYVNETSRFLVTLFDRKILDNPELQTIHLVNPHIAHLSDLLGDPKAGLTIRKLSFPDFVAELSAKYYQEGFSEYIDRLLLHLGWRDLLEGITYTHFSVHSDLSQKILSRYGVAWSVPEPAMMNRFLERALADRVRFLAKVSSFGITDPERLLGLARIITPASAKEGEIIQHENQPEKQVSILVHGFAEMFKRSVDGWQGTIRLLGPGDLYGEESLVPADAYSSVEAFEDLFLYTMDPGDLRDCIRKDPEIAFAFIRTLSGTIKQLESILIEVGI